MSRIGDTHSSIIVSIDAEPVPEFPIVIIDTSEAMPSASYGYGEHRVNRSLYRKNIEHTWVTWRRACLPTHNWSNISLMRG